MLYGDTDSKITKTKKDLSYNAQKEKNIKNSLDELSKRIISYQQTVQKIRISMKKLSHDIASGKQKAQIAKKKLKKIDRIIKTLNAKKSKVNKKLVGILAKEIKYSILAKNNSFSTNVDDLISSYINKTYSKILKDKFNKTKMKSLSLKLDLAYAKSEYDKLNSKVKSLTQKKQSLLNYEKLKKSTISKLEYEKKNYLKKLEFVRKQNSQLTNLLKKLNILKQKAKIKRQTIVLKKDNTNSLEVRRVGNIYNKPPVSSYHGDKTIAPFKRYKLVRKFGSFVDPTYKIKMFNPNIVLKPIGSKNVINVLDGKVISITNSPPIGNIIIIENKNGLHTLYAKLTTVAPTIKKGNYIKKGYILGKVKDTLFFEVTKNSTNINPLKLIK